VRILIVEDDEELATLLLRVLREEGYSVVHSATARAAIDLVKTSPVHLVLLDRMLPDLDGIEVCAALRKASAETAVLMLTAMGELNDRIDGLDAGADDYVIKPFEVEELLARIRAQLRRLDLPATVVGPLRLEWRRRSVTAGGALLDLTPREFALLAYLAAESERPCSRAELLRAVWHLRADPGTNVVEVYINRVRVKLGACAWALETVRGMGYRLLREPP
jgi:two-component system OmpR family response regulator